MAKKPKTKRRARGTGSIFPDAARGVWVGRVPVGRHPSGKLKYAEVSAPTQGECVRRMAALAPPAPSVTVAAWCGRWLGGQTTRPGTQVNTAGYARHVCAAMGRLRVADVRPSHVREFTASLLARFSPGFARNVVGFLRALLDAAVADDLIAKNPAKAVPKPKVPPRDPDVYTPEQLKLLIASSAAAKCGPIAAVLAATGCRIGEAAALDVADYRAGKLSITKTYCRKHGTGPPKSHRGRRTISVPAAAVGVVESAVGGRTAGVLFPSPGGMRYTASTLKSALKYHLRKLGLPVKKVHALRHSQITAMVGAGWSLADVARYAGDSLQTIVNTYVHPTGRDPVECLDKLFGG